MIPLLQKITQHMLRLLIVLKNAYKIGIVKQVRIFLNLSTLVTLIMI